MLTIMNIGGMIIDCSLFLCYVMVRKYVYNRNFIAVELRGDACIYFLGYSNGLNHLCTRYMYILSFEQASVLTIYLASSSESCTSMSMSIPSLY